MIRDADRLRRFTDPAMVAGYTARPPRQLPGYADLHRMVMLLLDEHAPADAAVLVLGAGGGLEMRAFADARPGWRLTGVDPSAPMLALARRTLGDAARAATWCEGYVEDAPAGPFDGATCLLTLHFMDRDERRATLAALRDRLAPGARLVTVQHSFPPAAADRWLARFAAFTGDAMPASGLPLPVLSPADDIAMLRDAGFADVELFYAALNFRGYVATWR